MCSLIDANLTTFDDIVQNTTEILKDNCWTLLAADCSDQSRFSVFIKSSANGSTALKVYAGYDVIEYDPQENVERILTVGGVNKFKLGAMDSRETRTLTEITAMR